VCRVLTTDDWSFFLDPEDRWEGLRSVIRIEATRQIGDVISTSVRYFISNLTWTAAQASKAVREHWGAENRLHWVLDVAFREDESRLRKGNGAHNLSVLRRLTLNLLRQDRTLKIGIKAKRLKAGWDNAYLLKSSRPNCNCLARRGAAWPGSYGRMRDSHRPADAAVCLQPLHPIVDSAPPQAIMTARVTDGGQDGQSRCDARP
jgi:predicted transposase YbfD/YdcC